MMRRLLLLLPLAFSAHLFGANSNLSPDFEEMIDRWTENARTNLTEETTVRFRDNVLIPFVRREIPNPFSPGGEEHGKPWAERAEKVYETGLRDMCGGWDSLKYLTPKNCEEAANLRKNGCNEPFITLLSALDNNLQWHIDPKESLKRIEEADNAIGARPSSAFLKLLVAQFKCLIWRGSYDDRITRFKEWLNSRKFSSEDELPVYYLHRTFFGNDIGCLEGFPFLSWACTVETAYATFSEASAVAGNGIASSFSHKGRQMMLERSGIALEMLNDADKIRPGRIESMSRRLYIAGECRRGYYDMRQKIFNEVSALRLDDPRTIGDYTWFNLYQRWGGSHSQMRRFAQACYNTKRHDTLLPYFYAETMCKFVRDSKRDPYEYFRTHPRVVDKCIEVCMRQATNELAHGYVRLRAPAVGAAVAYYAGRYEKAMEFAPYIQGYFEHFYSNYRDGLDLFFFDCTKIYDSIWAIYLGKYKQIALSLQRLYDEGKYKELLEQIPAIPGDAYDRQEFLRHVRTLEFNARMKVDFEEGKDVRAKVLSYFPGWCDEGWWRTDDWSWQTWKSFGFRNHVSWRAQIPKNHELELVLRPKPGTKGRHVLVVVRRVYEETRHLPLNGIPFVTFIWEKDRTGVYLENDYYKLEKIDPDRAVWKPAKGEERKIKVVLNDWRVEVFVDDGDEPVVSTQKYAMTIERSPEIGYASFVGDNVKISNIAVRKPQLHTGGK